MNASSIPGWELITAAIRAQNIARLADYVRQESVSHNHPQPIPDGIREMTQWVYGDLARIARTAGAGAAVEMVGTSTYPVVTATIPASINPDQAPWLLLYNMGDTRPIGNESEWLAPPLSCQTIEIEGERRIIGRGVFNSKSSLAGMIEVIKLLVEQGRLPVNLKVLIDFEEEVRVDAIREVITTQRDHYAMCQAALMPLCVEKFGVIPLGYKGVAVVRVTLKQHRSQVHSGMESVLSPPRLRGALDQLLQTIEWGNAHQLAIPALRGGLTNQDHKLVRQLASKLTLAEVAQRRGVQVEELRSQDVAQAIGDESRSHINILAWGPDRCEGTVPNTAFADLEFRISPSVTLTIQQIEEEISRYLTTLAEGLPEGITLDSVKFVAGTGEPYRAVAFDDPVVKTLQSSYAAFGVDMPPVPALFGSVPEGATIVRTLGIPFLVGGLGIGDRAHVANEYILEGAYQRLKEWLVVFLHQFAQQYK